MSAAPCLFTPHRPMPIHSGSGAGWHLRRDEVHLWTAPLDGRPPEFVDAMAALLAAEEIARAKAYRFERDRRRFVVGRGILRSLLARYLGRPGPAIALCQGAHGKPALTAAAGIEPPLHFNVAHSDGLALYAFTPAGEVGIDIEWIREMPEWREIATSTFPAPDWALILAAPEPQRPREFFRAWTRHEALVKARGLGLGGDVAGECGHVVHPLHPAPGYAAALAIGAGVRSATAFTWPATGNAGEFDGPGRDSPGRRLPLDPISHPGTDSL